jgi:hypothetical protein
MSKPRPANMFQHPQESTQAPKRDKLLFMEALAADRDLTLRELRVALLLTSFWSHTHGAAYPSMQWIADALGIDKRHISRALKGLEAKGWFMVERGSRGRGKNHVNRYRPNVEKVPSGAPFKTVADQVAAERAAREKGPLCSVKGASTSLKGASRGTLSDVSLSDVQRTYPADLRSASSFQADADSDRTSIARQLGKLESLLKAGYPETLASAERARWAEATYQALDEIIEAHDAHIGDPIGGWAYRLSEDVYPHLTAEPPTAEPTPPKGDLSDYPRGRAFGPSLGEARNKLGIQVRELADAIGLPAGDLFALEIGRTEVGRAMQRKYVDGLRGILEDGVSPLRCAS